MAVATINREMEHVGGMGAAEGAEVEAVSGAYQDRHEILCS